MNIHEQTLQNKLLEQLEELGYALVHIQNEADLQANLKTQLEKHNGIILTDPEFEKVLNHLDTYPVFDKAKILRDKMQLKRDNGESVYLEFIQQGHWYQNTFQMIHQSEVHRSWDDVTLLVNGLPLVQIDLWRGGLELENAFYQEPTSSRQSLKYKYNSHLFGYVQIFVISNGVNTRYYVNSKQQTLDPTFKQTFYWLDKDNKACHRLEAFAEVFLEPCHMFKMVTQYIVLHESGKALMILRPYQYYAVEAIVERVKSRHKNGYIWHTTGSGKTLTSFKASQILSTLPTVKKVVFVVDRKDLDCQTKKEFNHFSAGSIDGTNNTKALVDQFADDTKLIVTTIQKLDNAIRNPHFVSTMEPFKQEHVVFIFDECHHSSQFGETHQRITAFFEKAQLFCFTGTPIFAQNAVRNGLELRTTTELFDEPLHKYVITNAIHDENVLKFSIEYVGRYRQKDSKTNVDIEVNAVDTQALMDAPERIEKITDYIIANHGRKTYNRKYTAIFCVSSIDALIAYYKLFKQRKDEGAHDLKIATIFSYTSNEEEQDANGFIPEASIEEGTVNKHSREHLDAFIGDYNQMFFTQHSTRDSKAYETYFDDISSRMRHRDIDILLVVNMFLTGFDNKWLNTLYVDKNLRYHGLLQAYSRTNRILDNTKSHGNIVCFRNLKQATDDAITLFSDENPIDTITVKPYEDYVRKFMETLQELKAIAPTVDSVDDLLGEDQEFAFVEAFRELARLKHTMSTFSDFDLQDLALSEQDFEDYSWEYFEVCKKVVAYTQKEKDSDFIRVNGFFNLGFPPLDKEVNVTYILGLLARLKMDNKADFEKGKQKIIARLEYYEVNLGGEVKRELIERFIEQNMPYIDDVDHIKPEFERFWNQEKEKAFRAFCKEERLRPKALRSLLDEYLFMERPLWDVDVVSELQVPRTAARRVKRRLWRFVRTFIDNMF